MSTVDIYWIQATRSVYKRSSPCHTALMSYLSLRYRALSLKDASRRESCHTSSECKHLSSSNECAGKRVRQLSAPVSCILLPLRLTSPVTAIYSHLCLAQGCEVCFGDTVLETYTLGVIGCMLKSPI